MGELALPIQSPSELALAGRLTSDERLARLVSRGSERAFAVLYQRHHQALYRYCLSIVRDRDDAQDALQSAMTRALVALRAQERDLAVRPWLFRIAHNEAVSVLRRRRPTTPLAEDLESVGGGVERTLEGRERLATLIADLQALPVRQRSALVMRELSGLSIEEIAGALATSPGATKQVLFEARRALYDFAEGRAMECEQARRAISDGDLRVLRGRRLRGHLRECSGCANDRLRTGYGLPHQRGHFGTAAAAHEVLHRSPAGHTRSHRSSSSQPRHGASPKHQQAPPLPVKPEPRHDQSRGEPREPRPRRSRVTRALSRKRPALAHMRMVRSSGSLERGQAAAKVALPPRPSRKARARIERRGGGVERHRHRLAVHNAGDHGVARRTCDGIWPDFRPPVALCGQSSDTAIGRAVHRSLEIDRYR